MGWLTTKSMVMQSDVGNYITSRNQVYEDRDGNLYLVPRNTYTDGYTIPFGINRTKYDIRPATLHDIGCRYHKLIKINIDKDTLIDKYFINKNNKIICKDIDIEDLLLVDVKFNQLNNIFYNSMVDLDIPKYKAIEYRIGVEFNIGYIFTKNNKLDINNIYSYKLDT